MEVNEKRTGSLKFDEFISFSVKCFNFVCFNPMIIQKAVTKREKLWKIIRNAYLWLVVVNFAYSRFGMYTALIINGVFSYSKTVTSSAPN